MIFAASFHKGMVRQHNEDFFGIYEDPLRGCSLYIVADGIGGHNAGDVASRLAIEGVIHHFRDHFLPEYENCPEKFMTLVYESVNKYVYNLSREDRKLQGMGTTLVIFFAYKGKVYMGNIGDSRVYSFHKDFVQISKDHSYVEELVDASKITKEEAKHHPRKNLITRAIGIESGAEPDINCFDLKGDVTYLMCSDGLTNFVEDDAIKHILEKNITLDEKCGELIDEANKNGGGDNVTVVLIHNS